MRTKSIMLLIVLFGLLLIMACSKSDETIRIGSIQALTGETASFGLNAKDGIDLAVKEINDKGGINGKSLEIIYEDDQCNAKQGVTVAEKLIGVDEVKILLGPTCSSVAMAVAPIVETSKVIMFVSVASVPALKDSGDYIFRNSLAGALYANKIAEFAINTLNIKTASILFVNQENGIGYRDSFKKRFEELGGKILNIESYNKGDKDFRDQLLKFKNKKPDAIFIGGQAAENAVKQIKELGINSVVIGTVGLETPDMLSVAKEAAEGLYYSTASFNPDSTDLIISDFQKRYHERYGKKAEVFAANSYDATMLTADAIKKCDLNTDCIKEFLYGVKDYEGVSGLTTFDSDGEVIKPVIIKTVKNGKFVKYGD